MTEFKLGRLNGLQLSAMPSAIGGTIMLWLALIALAVGLLNFSTGAAVFAAFIAGALHWLADTLHQLGHARVFRRASDDASRGVCGNVGIAKSELREANCK